MWRGAAQWHGWMLGHRQRKHQKRVENREVQEASRRRGDPEAPPREGTVGDLRPEVSRSKCGRQQHNTTPWSGKRTRSGSHHAWHSRLGTHGRTVPAVDGATMQNINLYHSTAECQGVGPALLPDGDPGSRRRDDPADPGGLDARRLQSGTTRESRDVDGDEQPTRRLRIVEQLHEVGVEVPRKRGVAAEVLRVRSARPRNVPVTSSRASGEAGPAAASISTCSGSPPPSPTRGRPARSR